MELRPELTAVVGLDALDGEGKLGQDVVDEGDRSLLGVALVDLEDPDPRAVVDGGVLVVAPPARQRLQELHADLELVPRQRLLVLLIAVVPPAIAHAGGQPVSSRPLQQPPDPRLAELDSVVAVQVHRDPRAEVVGEIGRAHV